ncbi:MAG: alpha/beta hydrolase [Saprospiraceae bacterium]
MTGLIIDETKILAQSVITQTVTVTKTENVLYGMRSGLGLLMDIYKPDNANHLGVIYIAGSGWGSPSAWDDKPLKEQYSDTAYSGKWPQNLLLKGYTVFMINHSFTTKFQYPDIFYDCQRAVRFVRYNAKKYDIDSVHIGVMGHSSGANLASMLGVKDTTILNPKSEIDRVSSKVQAVVSLAAPYILSDYKKTDTAVLTSLMSRVLSDYLGDLPKEKNGEYELSGKFAAASPITYVSSGDAAFLLYYSDDDPYIPSRQAPAFYKALTDKNVKAKIILCHNCKHQPMPDMNEVDMWYRTHLK